VKWIIICILFFFPIATHAAEWAPFLNPRIKEIDRQVVCSGWEEAECRAVFLIKGKNFINSNESQGVKVGKEWAEIHRWTDTMIVASASEETLDSALIVSVNSTVERPVLISDDNTLVGMFEDSVQVAIDSIEVADDGTRFLIAGPKYVDPDRTYYRDSYWTAGMILMIEPYVVRDQIHLLSRGVKPDGKVPSAITIDPNAPQLALWADHQDSGAYFIMMIYDYIRWTGDDSILHDVVGGRKIFTIMEDVITNLAAQDTDGNFLPEKPKDSLQDWLDTIPRSGEVLYNEVLYYRALRNLTEMAEWVGEPEHALSFHRYSVLVRHQINKQFWNDTKGYYYESCSAGKCIDRLTNESSLAILYEVIDSKNRDRFFSSLRNLESAYNYTILHGDWGVLNAYPFYPGSAPYKYQNGTDWPFLDGMNAGARLKYRNDDWYYPLTRWWTYNQEQHPGRLLPEYVSPRDDNAGVSQAWSVNPAVSFVRYGIGLDPGLDGGYTVRKSPNGDVVIKNLHIRGKRIAARAKGE